MHAQKKTKIKTRFEKKTSFPKENYEIIKNFQFIFGRKSRFHKGKIKKNLKKINRAARAKKGQKNAFWKKRCLFPKKNLQAKRSVPIKKISC